MRRRGSWDGYPNPSPWGLLAVFALTWLYVWLDGSLPAHWALAGLGAVGATFVVAMAWWVRSADPR